MAHCNQCGYDWTPKVNGVEPKVCTLCKRYDYREPNKKTRKVAAEGVKGVLGGSNDGAKKVQDLPQRAARTSRPGKLEQVQVGVQKVSRESSSGRHAYHCQVEPDSAASERIMTLAEELKDHPFRGSGKCPHNYMNWMTCHNSGGGC
jgi:hypothetical protein